MSFSLQKHVKNASDVEYPAYGITGPNKDVSPSGDRRLAQSAQMYHYQHQKQQIIAMERYVCIYYQQIVGITPASIPTDLLITYSYCIHNSCCFSFDFADIDSATFTPSDAIK